MKQQARHSQNRRPGPRRQNHRDSDDWRLYPGAQIVAVTEILAAEGHRDGYAQKCQGEPRQSGREHDEESLHRGRVRHLRSAAQPIQWYRVLPLSGEFRAPLLR